MLAHMSMSILLLYLILLYILEMYVILLYSRYRRCMLFYCILDTRDAWYLTVYLILEMHDILLYESFHVKWSSALQFTVSDFEAI